MDVQTIFLTNDEIQQITEYRRPTDQRAELMRQGYKFEVTRSGRPLVLREACYECIGTSTQRYRVSPEPNFSAIEQ